MTDEEILTLALKPETRETGYRQLVNTYQQRLYQVVRRQVPSHDDADDVLQNTFIKIFKHLKQFEARSSLYTWMYRIATNEIYNFQKKRSRMKIVGLGTREYGEAESYVNVDQLSSTLELIVDTLPDRQQMVFRMRYYDELTYKQIAEILQLTEGALKASFHHAVKKIETELKTKQFIE
jgi:RNA polymerase sigma-70 factor (ECF subfamily)